VFGRLGTPLATPPPEDPSPARAVRRAPVRPPTPGAQGCDAALSRIGYGLQMSVACCCPLPHTTVHALVSLLGSWLDNGLGVLCMPAYLCTSTPQPSSLVPTMLLCPPSPLLANLVPTRGRQRPGAAGRYRAGV
jgi:hypothetical protein